MRSFPSWPNWWTFEFRGTSKLTIKKQKHTSEQFTFSPSLSDLKVQPGTNTKKEWFHQQPNRWQARNGCNLLRIAPANSSMEFNLPGWGLLFSAWHFLHSRPGHSLESCISGSSSARSQVNPSRQARVLSYDGILLLHWILFQQMQLKLLIITKPTALVECF